MHFPPNFFGVTVLFEILIYANLASRSQFKFEITPKSNSVALKFIILETKELGNAISEHFFQRCGVAILDVGYPSNFATFGDLVEEVPALIIKNPKQIHKLFHHKDINAEMIHFHHQDIKEWGQIVEHRELGTPNFKKV